MMGFLPLSSRQQGKQGRRQRGRWPEWEELRMRQRVLRQVKTHVTALTKWALGVGIVLALTSQILSAQDLPYIEKTQKTMRLAHGVVPGAPYDLGAHRFA
jgi:hypothetical protein